VEYLANGYDGSLANDVSIDGRTAVGGLGIYQGGLDEVFRWTTSGGLQPLGTLPGFRIGGVDVSSDGKIIAGTAIRHENGRVRLRPFRWTDETGMVELGTLPSGFSDVGVTSGTPDMSTLVGGFGAYPDEQVPARWTEATGWLPLPDLEGGDTQLHGPVHATDVSADGSIIVGRGVDATGAEPFIWDAIHGTRNFTAVLREEFGLSAALNGWNLTLAGAISHDGRTIAGYGRNPSGENEYWVAHLGTAENIPLSGDYNSDGTVDAADYVVWRNSLGQAGAALAADGDASGIIDTNDYNIWRSHFGQSAVVASSISAVPSSGIPTVPEPSAIVLTALLYTLLAMCWRVRIRRTTPPSQIAAIYVA
jgi:probable HAF family extracellular repeat protein